MKTFPACLACAVLLGAAASSLAQTPSAAAAQAQHAPAPAAAPTDVAPDAEGAVAVVEAFGKALGRGDLHGDLAWVGTESELHASVHIHWSSRPKRITKEIP